MNYKDFNLGDWIGHISGVIEDESELDGNEMRDLVKFLTTLKQEPLNDVLDKIKAEIKDIIQWYMDHGQEDCSQVLTSAIEIIDKYRERYTE